MGKKIKKVDISAIEEAISEKRNEERILGQAIHEKADADLFVIDAKGDSEIKKKVKSQRLKIDEILTPNSKFSLAPSKITKSRPENKLVKKLAKKLQSNKIAPNEKNKSEECAIYHIWEDPENIPKIKGEKQVAVELAHPGMSYRPTVVDHSEIITTAAQVEIKKMEENQKIQDRLAFPEELSKLTPMEEVANKELFESDKEDNSEPEDNSNEVSYQAKQARKKTKAEKNKELRNRQKREEEAKNQLDKKIAKQIDLIGYFKKELKTKQKRIQKDMIISRPKKLGKFKIKDLPIPVQLSDELASSLRNMKPEGNLLKERFVSFQKRAIIEPREPTKIKPRYRLKEYEKKSYKYYQ